MPGPAIKGFVGLNMFGLAQCYMRYYHKVRSFSEQMDKKYRRITAFQKPVIIAEFGVTGGQDFQQAWWRPALQGMKNYPLLQTSAHFHAKGTPCAPGPRRATSQRRTTPQ